MQNFIQLFTQITIDFLFPPSKEEHDLRVISPKKFFEISPKSSKTEFPFIKSLFSYKNPLVRELIWQIKYKKNKHAIECAGYVLFNELNKINASQITLIPIPISNKRRKERGYNQCEMIIDEIIKLDTEKKFNSDYKILIRNKDIEKQTFKNKNERIENTKNIFEIRENYKNLENISDVKIIIIDDVSTTGSTLKEAREVLLEAGYNNIEALTIAH